MRCYYVSSTCLLFYFTVLLLFFFVNLTLNVHANVPDERSTVKILPRATHATNTSARDRNQK